MKKLNISLDSIEPFFKKISELTKIQRILISAGTVIAIIALFVLVFYMPKIDAMNRVSKNIRKSEDKLAKTKKNAQKFNSYKKKMEDAKVRFHEIAQELPNTDEIPSLLTNISLAGKEAGLQFLLFDPKKEVKKAFYAEIPVSMKLSGAYHDLGMFFDRLARLSRIVNVTQFSIKGSSNSNRPLNIACKAVTYKFVAPKAKKKKKSRRRRRRK